jgi:hypothetical protein
MRGRDSRFLRVRCSGGLRIDDGRLAVCESVAIDEELRTAVLQQSAVFCES